MRQPRVADADVKQNADGAGESADLSGDGREDGRVSACPSLRAYRPERISNHDDFDASSSQRHSQRSSRAPIAVRAGDAALPPDPESSEPRAVDGHPLDRQEDTNPGLGSIRGMGASSRAGDGNFDGDPIIRDPRRDFSIGEERSHGPASAVPASVERVRSHSGRVAVTRLAPMVVSDKARGAARAALERHAAARPPTVRGLGGSLVAPALDAVLNADDPDEGRNVLALSPTELAHFAASSDDAAADWMPEESLDPDPEFAPLQRKRWLALLVGVVFVVAAGVLVLAVGIQLLGDRQPDEARRQGLPGGAAITARGPGGAESSREAAAVKVSSATEPGAPRMRESPGSASQVADVRAVDISKATATGASTGPAPEMKVVSVRERPSSRGDRRQARSSSSTSRQRGSRVGVVQSSSPVASERPGVPEGPVF